MRGSRNKLQINDALAAISIRPMRRVVRAVSSTRQIFYQWKGENHVTQSHCRSDSCLGCGRSKPCRHSQGNSQSSNQRSSQDRAPSRRRQIPARRQGSRFGPVCGTPAIQCRTQRGQNAKRRGSIHAQFVLPLISCRVQPNHPCDWPQVRPLALFHAPGRNPAPAAEQARAAG